MSGAFPISTAKFGTLGIKSIQNTIISKSVSGKRLVRQIDNQRWAFSVQIITGKRSDVYGELMAFIVKQRGQKETFTIIPPELEDARGNESWNSFNRWSSCSWRYYNINEWHLLQMVLVDLKLEIL
jgi:hypothetical protein